MRPGVSTPAIALDASLWDEPTTGIGLYTRCLVQGLNAQGLSVQCFGARESGVAPRGKLGRTAYVFKRLPDALRASSAELFHALGNFNLPLRRLSGKAYVLTLHDLIPLLMPETVSWAYRWQFRLWLAHSVALADQIICVSERTRKDLLARFPEAAAKSVVVHNGVDHVDAVKATVEDMAFLEALNLPEHYALYAGSLDVRKNVQLVLDACERLYQQGQRLTLVLLGQSWFGSSVVEKRIERLRTQGLDLRVLGYQPETVFYEVMRRASVFLFPSRYEGFGLPPLEAMRLGVPTVVGRAGSLPEVCGEAALYVDPEDVQGLARTLSRLLESPEECRDWSAKGRAHAKAFTWKRTAEQTWQVYQRALAARSS